MNGQSVTEYVRGTLEVSGLLNVNGGYYARDMRPFNSSREDVVVSVMNAYDGQIQEGFVTINVYVPDVLYSDGQYHCDAVRTNDIASALEGVCDALNGGEILFLPSVMAQTYEETAIRQHYVSIRVRFRYLNV